MRRNGDPFFSLLNGGDFVLGTQYDVVEMSAGWTRDSRNRLLFPDVRLAAASFA